MEVDAAPVTNANDEMLIDEQDEMEEEFNKLDIQNSNAPGDYLSLLQNDRIDDDAVKIKEKVIYKLAKIYTETKHFEDVLNLLKSNNDFFGSIPKAKTAKIVRNILNIVAAVPDSLKIQIQLCKDVIEWCKLEKRTFLRQRIEAKLAALLLQNKEASTALQLVNSLLAELKKLDDKQMLTEVHLTESRVHHALQNIPKSKASLTASRTAANSIYVTPLLQAEIDEMSGTLHCEEGDHTTAYSYFLEAFEAYDQGKDTYRAMICLKYMILAKILSNNAADVPSIVSGKLAIKHTGPHIEAMSNIAKAAKLKSLEEFTAIVTKYEQYLKTDDLISHQLDKLYQQMLELNLLKIVHPYSCVEISYIAKMIKLSEVEVERKLSQMILDHQFYGILDQGKGYLIIYDHSKEDKAYTKGLEVISNMNQVVDALFIRAKAIEKTS